MLSQTEIALIGTELLDTGRSGDCYSILDRWLPRMVYADHFNYLFADLKAGSYVRGESAGTRGGAMIGHPAPCLASDLILRLRGDGAAGSYVHLAGLKSFAGQPESRDDLKKRLGGFDGRVDSITIVLFFDRVREHSLGLTVWLTKPESSFTCDEICNFAIVGPLFSAAFRRAIEEEIRRLNDGVSVQILAGADQFAFLVSQRGDPLIPDRRVENRLKNVFGGGNGPGGLPVDCTALFAELISSLAGKSGPGICSKEVTRNGRRCRVHLSRVEPSPFGTTIFKVMVDCNPEASSLSTLADAGLTEFQINVVELVKGGFSNAQIARTLNVSTSDLNYHLRRIGDKIYAAGKIEIVARALTLHREIADCRGLLNPLDGLVETAKAGLRMPAAPAPVPAG